MRITLTPRQTSTLHAYVASGEFPSVEAAAQHLLDERIAAREADDGLAWTRPYVAEALDDVLQEHVITLEEYLRRRQGGVVGA